MSLVCLSLTARTIAENLTVLERYRGKVDLLELRADLLDPSEAFAVRDFPIMTGLPTILRGPGERFPGPLDRGSLPYLRNEDHPLTARRVGHAGRSERGLDGARRGA